MGEPLYGRLEPEFTFVHRTKSAIDLVTRRLCEFQGEEGHPKGFGEEVQILIDTLWVIGRGLTDVGGEIETIVLDFERAASPASDPPPPAPHLGPPRLVVDNTPHGVSS